MKKRKIRKEIISVVGDSFVHLDQTLFDLIGSFKDLHKDVIKYETRIAQLEKAIYQKQEDTLLTENYLAETLVRNYNLTRQLKVANARADYFYDRLMKCTEQLSKVKNELKAQKEAGNKVRPDMTSEKAANAGEHAVNEAAA